MRRPRRASSCRPSVARRQSAVLRAPTAARRASGAARALASSSASTRRRAASSSASARVSACACSSSAAACSAALLRPRLVEHVRGAADRAVVGEPLRVADRQRAAQQRGDVGRARRVGLRGVLVRALGDAQRLERLADLLVGRHVRGRPGGAAARCPRCSPGASASSCVDRVQVRLAGAERGGDQRGVLVVRVQPRDQRVLARAPTSLRWLS